MADVGASFSALHQQLSQTSAQPTPNQAHVATASSHTSALFVKGLNKSVNERMLYAIFSAFGPLQDVQVARHRSGRSAGFAVVQFARREDATRALLVMENAVLAGRRLNVRWYTPELQHSTQQGAGGDWNLAKALAAMLGSGMATPQNGLSMAPQPQALPEVNTAALAQQLLMQQLATALAQAQASNTARSVPAANSLNMMQGSMQFPGGAWGDATATLTPRDNSSTPRKEPILGLTPQQSGVSWMEASPRPDLSHATGPSQIDSWARHSIDNTSSPTLGPRRRTTQPGARRSLESAEFATVLRAGSPGPSASEHAGMDSQRASGTNVPMTSAINSDGGCSATPCEQSEDGSCSVFSTSSRPLRSTVIKTAPSEASHDDGPSPFADAKGELSDDDPAHRISAGSIHLPDTLFEKPVDGGKADADKVDNNSGLRQTMSNPAGMAGYNSSNDGSVAKGGYNIPGLKPALSAAPRSLHMNANNQSSSQMNIFNASTPQLDMAGAMNFGGMSLDSNTPRNKSVAEATVRQAESIIAHFNAAVKAQALLNSFGPGSKPHTPRNNIPIPPAALSSPSFDASSLLLGNALGMNLAQLAANNNSGFGMAGNVNANAGLEALMGSSGVDLQSLNTLMQLQQGMQNMYSA